MVTTVKTTFVIRNQEGQYLSKKKEWLSGKESAGLYHQPHYDQALNELIEVNAKDIHLRGEIVELNLCEKRRPVVVEYGPDPEQPELLDEAIESSELNQGDSAQTSAQKSADGAEAVDDFQGFIRPLNVEPRVPKKAQASEETVD